MSVLSREPQIETLADLIASLGGIPLDRVRFRPAPGMATEQDVIELDYHDDRLCELVNGVLVEKPMGSEESSIALEIGTELKLYMRQHKLGIVAGPDGMMLISTGLVRIPDVSVVLWTRVPNRKLPSEPIPALAPDLAVEVLSSSNTAGEMNRKLAEYFAAGTQCVWLVDPVKRSVRVYHSETDFADLTGDDLVTAEPVLPGFGVTVTQIFEGAGLD